MPNQSNFSFLPDIVFPLAVPPLNPYWEHNQTSFGWRRDKGHRLHAGVDLEAHANTPVLAMADGVVLRVALFYEGTSAIEVQHPSLGIVRYGEVDRHKILAFKSCFVRKGQTIGFVGKRDGASRFMLHLELYSDWTRADLENVGGKDHLSQAQAPYQRRNDLRNPTALLQGAPVQSLEHITLTRGPSKVTVETMKLENILKRAKQISLNTAAEEK